MVSSALASCLEEAVAAASSSGEPASMLIGFESCANAAADCMKAALAKATAHGDAQVKVLASMVACVALQPELPESIANSDSAQGSLWTTVASTLQPDMDEVGVAALTLSSSAGDDAFAWVGPFFVRAWAFLRWYNAIQLVVMPWVIAWLFSGCLIGIMRFVRFQYHIWRTGIDVAALLLLNVLILVEDFVSSCCSGLFGLVNRTHGKRLSLERALRNCKTYAEWRDAHHELDIFLEEAGTCCSKGRCVKAINKRHWRPGTQEEHQLKMRLALAAATKASGWSTDGADLATLEPLMVREAAGINWVQMPCSSEYLVQLSECLEAACETRLQDSANPEGRDELLCWLRNRQQALGCTALCLSGGGSLAMYHMGVCRFLLEENLMPQASAPPASRSHLQFVFSVS